MYTDKEKLTILEIAKYLDRDIETVTQWIESGRLKSVCEKGVIYVSMENVKSWNANLNSVE